MHLWTLLHFPLHAAFLLTVESIGQLIIWGTLNDQTNHFTRLLASVTDPIPETVSDFAANLNSTLTPWLASLSQSATTGLQMPNLTHALQELAHQKDLNSTETDHLVTDIILESLDYLFEILQIEPPKAVLRAAANAAALPDSGHDQTTIPVVSAEQHVEQIIDVFVTIFYYTFAAAGGALIMLGVLHWVGIRRKNRADYLSIGVKWFVGLGLGLLILLAVVNRKSDGEPNDAFGNFYSSPWVLPTVMLALGSGKSRHVAQDIHSRKKRHSTNISSVLVSHNLIFHVFYRKRLRH
jgi:hypothetical protein